jgi:hypothetical protein
MFPLRRWIHDAAVTRAFYGSVVYASVVTVMAAEDQQPPAQTAMAAVVGTALILYVAHGFSELVPRIVHAGRLTGGDLAHVAAMEVPLLLVALVPILPLAAASIGVLDLSTGYRWSVGLTVGALFVLAIAFCVRDGLSWSRSLVAALSIVAATAVVIYLEALVSH